MKSSKSKALTLTRDIAAGLLIGIAIAFFFRKWDAPSNTIAQRDVDQVCRSVVGCKELAVEQRFAVSSFGWVTKVRLTLHRKNKNPSAETQVREGLVRLWAGKRGWQVPSLQGYSLEVDHE